MNGLCKSCPIGDIPGNDGRTCVNGESIFEIVPKFEKYNAKNIYTKRIIEYWTNLDLAGGPLTKDLKTSSVEKIKTPLAALIADTELFGFYQIHRFQETSEGIYKNMYFDITLLNTD